MPAAVFPVSSLWNHASLWDNQDIETS